MKDNEIEATIIGALLDIKAQLARIEALLTQQYPQIPQDRINQFQQTEKTREG